MNGCEREGDPHTAIAGDSESVPTNPLQQPRGVVGARHSTMTCHLQARQSMQVSFAWSSSGRVNPMHRLLCGEK